MTRIQCTVGALRSPAPCERKQRFFPRVTSRTDAAIAEPDNSMIECRAGLYSAHRTSLIKSVHPRFLSGNHFYGSIR